MEFPQNISNSDLHSISSHTSRKSFDRVQSDLSVVTIHEADEMFLRVKAQELAEVLERSAAQLRWKANGFNSQEKTRRERRPRLPWFVTDYLLVLTSVWQILCVIILVFVDLFAKKSEEDSSAYYLAGIIILVVFQVINLIVAFAASVKLAKQYIHHTASIQFLIQSYLSTLVLFGGLYLLIYRIEPSAFENVLKRGGKKILVVELFMRMLFFSISTGTLCGGAPVVASSWYSEIVMSCQMLLSFVYFASVLSQFVNPSFSSKSDSKKDKKEFTTSSRYGSISRRAIGTTSCSS